MWKTPVLRYVFLLLNAAMCISAVTHGAHYLVDVLAGMAIAAGTIAAVSRICIGDAGRRVSAAPISQPDRAAPAAAA